ncbi:MAG TPA: hypothetical protein VJU59_03250 [Paraburkholderia sp.]|uniref:hypothetical protein n=1 Tax=Paraburkholderia sp. TaxID=1926495 RepID=UPI002B458EFB|nr:hypothetical protein [Paraburkholderia sp.]HKR38685.1 hypothetical protein [Paraburkholderia sp.]
MNCVGSKSDVRVAFDTFSSALMKARRTRAQHPGCIHSVHFDALRGPAGRKQNILTRRTIGTDETVARSCDEQQFLNALSAFVH